MRIAVHVTPRSRVDEVIPDRAAGVIRVRVTAPAEAGRANRAVLALLRERLGLASGAVRLVGGAASRRKWIEAEGIEERELWHRLAPEP